MMRVALALVLLTLGFVAGSLLPRATAADSAAGIVQELRGIHGELTQIRRGLEKR